MIDLESVSGLPIEVGDDNKLKFNSPLQAVEPKVRTYEEMKTLYLDQNADPGTSEMYYMYRGVHLPEDKAKIKDLGLTYDITVIPPGKIGQEFNKTAGHYHGLRQGTAIAYPEIYEVLHGKALFILQKMDPEFKRILSVLVMEAEAGQKVIYPPNYGHIIVNATDDVLITSNWVDEGFERLYQPIRDRQGMIYYVLQGEAGEEKAYQLKENPNYDDKAPLPRILTNKYMDRFSIMDPAKPMYFLGVTEPKNLEFLMYPEKYAVELSAITS